jgi:AcrR family transcriptional regulator
VAAPGGRGAARETAILQAVLELLAESGYDQLTIDAVAARARCSKATIYRRWPDKAALVITAVRQHAGQPAMAVPDTGSLRSDLLAALQAMRSSLSGQDAALILGLLIAMHRDPELADVVRQQVLLAKREVFDAVIARAAARGDARAAGGGGGGGEQRAARRDQLGRAVLQAARDRRAARRCLHPAPCRRGPAAGPRAVIPR